MPLIQLLLKKSFFEEWQRRFSDCPSILIYYLVIFSVSTKNGLCWCRFVKYRSLIFCSQFKPNLHGICPAKLTYHAITFGVVSFYETIIFNKHFQHFLMQTFKEKLTGCQSRYVVWWKCKCIHMDWSHS